MTRVIVTENRSACFYTTDCKFPEMVLLTILSSTAHSRLTKVADEKENIETCTRT